MTTIQKNRKYSLWGEKIRINFLIVCIPLLLHLVCIQIYIFDQNPDPDYGSFWNVTYRSVSDDQYRGV